MIKSTGWRKIDEKGKGNFIPKTQRQTHLTTYKHTREDNINMNFNPYPTAFPYGNGMVLHFYQQQESSTTKTVHKVINRGLKTYV